MIEYKEYNGFYFHPETCQGVMDILTMFQFSTKNHNALRLRLYYGDNETGKDWQECHDTTGYIVRSTGSQKIPLLIYNKNCYGGGDILTHCIVKIEYANKANGGILWQHANYHKEI